MGALAIPALIGAAGSIFGGLFGANASNKAAKQYIDALNQAQGSLRTDEATGLQNYSPYLSGGSTSQYQLSDLLSRPGQGLLTPWTQQFTAPTAEQAEQTPGYQFQLQQGENAIQNSAAAKGGLLSGRTLADLNTFAQGTASQNYQNVFNNSLTQYQQAYNSFLNNQQNTYQRLLGNSTVGLQAAQGAGGLISGIGGDIASLFAQKGAAQAAGTTGAANAYSSIFPGIGSSITNYLLLKNLGIGGNSGGSNPYGTQSLPFPGGGTYNGAIDLSNLG